MTTVVLSPRPAGVRRALAVLGTLGGCFFFGFASVIVAFALLPRLAGRESWTILSGSMQPTFGVGDVVIDRPIHPEAIRVGDIVTFRDPDHPSRLLTHRVVRLRIYGSVADVVTKGDANHTVERWSIPLSGTLGLVEFRLPRLGFVVRTVGGRAGRLLLLVVPTLLLGAYELRRIWRPRAT